MVGVEFLRISIIEIDVLVIRLENFLRYNNLEIDTKLIIIGVVVSVIINLIRFIKKTRIDTEC